MKKVLCALLVLGIILTSSFTVFAATAGDVNSDGKINSSDALLILQYSVGSNPSGFNKNIADMNSDGKINASDALTVLQIAVGSINPTMSKDDIIKLYNDSVKKSYDQIKCTLVVSDDVNITVNEVLTNGVEDTMLKTLFENLTDYDNEDVKYTFYKGKTLRGEKIEDIIAYNELNLSDIESATAVAYNGGYKLTIGFFDEEIPIDGLDIPLLFEYCTAKFKDPEIIAVIDSKGRISSIEFHASGNIKASTKASEDSPSTYMDMDFEETITNKFTY
ncbi:MAG: dockerin type I repeat-containing protein [Acutalibacteraceae bacterium]|nr:dockerin type I repeat-containing protein [Acutalibacteraceae bacterium]